MGEKILRIFAQLAITGVLMSCQAGGATRLEQALALSGQNRCELEKVISCFSQSSKDSIHLKAALFLIENMPGHHMLESEYLTLFADSVDAIYPDMSKVMKSVVYTIPCRHDANLGKTYEREDIEHIKSDFLIKHIKNRVRMWKECSWLERLSFEDFCDYLLPYRITVEPLLPDDRSAQQWQTVNNVINHFGYNPYLLSEVKNLRYNLLGEDDKPYFSGISIPGMSAPTFLIVWM